MLDLGFREELEYLLAPGARRAAHAAVLGHAAAGDPEAGRHLPARRRPARSPGRGRGGGHADIQLPGPPGARARSPGGGGQRAAGRAGRARRSCSAGRARGWASCTSGWWITASRRWRSRATGRRAIAIGRWRRCATGRARVLVATNVAARGLDLPDVDLVVHADLPDNAESLTHRSGRTGRAGTQGHQHGASPRRAERRKAERLLQAALGRDEDQQGTRWSPAPGADEVRRSLEEQVLAERAGRRPSDAPRTRQRRSARGGAGAGRSAAGGAARAGAGGPAGGARAGPAAAGPAADAAGSPAAAARPPPDARRPGSASSPAKRPMRPGPPGAAAADGPRRRCDHDRTPFSEAVIFRVNLGRDAKAEPGWLLPLICRRGGVTRREVGAIRVGASSSTFEIASEAAQDFALAAGRARSPGPARHHRTGDASPPPATHGAATRAARGLSARRSSRSRRSRRCSRRRSPRRRRPPACGPRPGAQPGAE